jgi:probable F420-dependent oxidoreductase
VPVTARVLAAIGPRMLRLARERSAGAYPFMITPDYTAQARAVLGQDVSLAVGQLAVVERDPRRARELARGPLRFLTGRGGPYADSLRRIGFADDEIAALSDRLVDAVVAWGDVDAVAARVGEHRQAGADQVALSVVDSRPPGSLPMETLRRLAAATAT